MLPWDHIGLCTQVSKFPLHKNPHSKEWGKMVFTILTSITKIQVMISIEIHAFYKDIFVHGC
jgi:hypothetical protein